jgi:ribosomal protein L40E
LEWICPSCGTRNPGPKKTCVNCGAPQPENVQFERAADEQIVTDESAIREARAGADYICPYCGTRNAAQAELCVQCGGDLVEAKRRAAGNELQAPNAPKTAACANCGTLNPVSNSNCSKCGSPLPRSPSGSIGPQRPLQTARMASSGKPKWFVFGAIGAALLICAAVLLLFVFPSSTVQARVIDVYWQTSVPLQEVRSVQHADEAGHPPSGAYDISCRTETRQVCTEKVIDQGNGYGEKVQDCHDENQDYCSYTVDEWQTIQTYTLEGHDFSPAYSQPSVASGQRLGDRSADYTVTFDTQKGQKSYSPSNLADFTRFSVGSAWALKLNAFGGIVGVEQ